MGAIKVHEFMTLDGIIDTPMWTMDYPFTGPMEESLGRLTGSCSAVLLGRRTYEMFAQAWPNRTVDDDPGAPFFNDTRKHVVSSTLQDPPWGPATVLPYDAEAIRRLKGEADGDVYVSGSATLVRAMLADGLVDELHLLTYPVALGEGIRLFPQGAPRTTLRLLGAQTYDNEVVHLVYGP
jgi:dihydrofolate reductase